MNEDKPNGWKWVSAGLAAVVIYQAGRDGAASPPADTAYAAPLAATSPPPLPLFDLAAPAAPAPTEPAPLTDGHSEPDPVEAVQNTAGPWTRYANVTETPDDGGPCGSPNHDCGEDAPSNATANLAEPGNRAGETTPAPQPAAQLSDATAGNGYSAPAPAPSTYAPRLGCAENGSCYGDISSGIGRPRTVHVGGYYRRDGTYVRGHYRSSPRR